MITIPGSVIKVPRKMLVESALPQGYISQPNDVEDIFLVLDKNNGLTVGYVTFRDNALSFYFLGGKGGEAFKKAFLEKYSEYDPERIVWAVFQNCLGVKAIVSGWYASREEAIAEAQDYMDADLNPYLCSVRAEDAGKMSFMTLTSFEMILNLDSFDDDFSEEDEGPIRIELTNLEGF